MCSADSSARWRLSSAGSISVATLLIWFWKVSRRSRSERAFNASKSFNRRCEFLNISSRSASIFATVDWRFLTSTSSRLIVVLSALCTVGKATGGLCTAASASSRASFRNSGRFPSSNDSSISMIEVSTVMWRSFSFSSNCLMKSSTETSSPPSSKVSITSSMFFSGSIGCPAGSAGKRSVASAVARDGLLQNASNIGNDRDHPRIFDPCGTEHA